MIIKTLRRSEPATVLKCLPLGLRPTTKLPLGVGGIKKTSCGRGPSSLNHALNIRWIWDISVNFRRYLKKASCGSKTHAYVLLPQQCNKRAALNLNLEINVCRSSMMRTIPTTYTGVTMGRLARIYIFMDTNQICNMKW